MKSSIKVLFISFFNLVFINILIVIVSINKNNFGNKKKHRKNLCIKILNYISTSNEIKINFFQSKTF